VDVDARGIVNWGRVVCGGLFVVYVGIQVIIIVYIVYLMIC
jgi:hypothetical protein